jgi:CHAT domain-containing protein/tetratricopeptide (TPR) repeat protein
MTEQEVETQIYEAAGRLTALSESIDGLAVARANLDIGVLWLKKGVVVRDRVALLNAIEHARKGLARAGDDDSLLCANLWAVGATALCRLYEIDGDLSLLDRGLADLRRAYATFLKHGSASESEAVARNLAVSLVRAGEQYGDLALLREGLALATALLSEPRTRPKLAELYVLVNAKAVAQLRIGAYGADTALVEAAVQTLRTFLKGHELSAEARRQTMQNLCAALIENARKLRSQRVYHELLSVLSNLSHPIRDDLSAYFAHYYAQASNELFRLSGDTSLGEQAISTLEELVRWHNANPFLRLEALHSLAQAHFQVGKQRESEEHFTEAVRATEAALLLANPEVEATDSRRHRLLADLGAYKFALGLKTKNHKLVEEAAVHYRSALRLISPLKAPSLFVAAAKGLFYLCYQQKEWLSALEVFVDIEDAWARIIADSRLSGAVHLQGARELAGEYARAAWAHLQVGDLTAAALTLDRGRARQLHVALNVGLQSVEQLPGSDKETLAVAAKAVEVARASASDDDCRRAWEEYLTLRRRLGLDAEVQQLSVEATRSKIPDGGAIVQLLIAREGSAAFILSKTETLVRVILLPPDTQNLLNALFHNGDSEGHAGWLPTYKRFVGSVGSDAGDSFAAELPTRSSIRYRDWSEMVTHAQRVLGQVVFAAVHKTLVQCGFRVGAEVVLCPPGELACLPLSTALLNDGTEFCSHWSVSVTPRISILDSQAFHGSPHTLLAISPPAAHTTRLENLPFAEREASLIKSRFSEGASTYLEPECAGVSEVLHGMERASVVHAACHGVYDWMAPEKSGLELAHDRRLTVRTLSSSVGFMRNVRLMFLSACESAVAGVTLLPDEFTGLPVSFLQAGARAVIGTLWAVFDDAAMLICDRFYHYYLDEQGREAMPPARALSLAQAWLRQVSVRELCELGYFSRAEAQQLFTSAAPGALRLRGLEFVCDERTNKSVSEVSEARPREAHVRLSEESLNLRPYASAAEWAGFVTFGR